MEKFVTNRAGSVVALVLCLATVSTSASAQERRGSIDFLNERLRIPDSERFDEGDYIDSGVGLKFGVDKRLSYLSGNYEEAAERFEEALKGFRYKSEIWVYLARSYFYMKSPEKAKQTVEKAASIMPDLKERFWNPLLESMLGEIRKRVNNLQTQVDFYSKSQEDFFNLFRLFKFLEDYQGASGVIHAAEAKAARMNELATMVSGNSQRTYRQEARKWQDLAQELRGELQALGVEVLPGTTQVEAPPLSETTGKDPELLEATRILYLKVYYYQSRSEDFRELFNNYLRLGMPERTREVVEALGQEIQRAKLQADIAPDVQKESEYLQKAAALEELQRELKAALPEGTE